MKKIETIVFWQNMNSHHQSAFMSELASLGGREIIWVVEKEAEDTVRGKHGWMNQRPGNVTLVARPDKTRVNEILGLNRDSTLHVFTGIFGERQARVAFFLAALKGCCCAILSEPPLPMTGINTIRPLYQHVYFRFFRKRIVALWGIGRGKDWLLKSGFASSKVFDWAYFPAIPSTVTLSHVEKNKILFVGQLVKRKGLDLLLEALCSLEELPWRLSVVGSGSSEESFKAIAERFDIGDRIEWLGNIPNTELLKVLPTASVTVVPSRHDGWGAVTNESLGLGIPTIVSSQTGSSVLIEEGFNGSVFDSHSREELVAKLKFWLERSDSDQELRQKIVERSQQTISPKVGAAYFARCLEFVEQRGPKPVAPWISSA